MDLNTVLDLVADGHRRKTLLSLSDQNPQEEMAAVKTAHFGTKDLDELRMELIRVHLPKMNDVDVIDRAEDSQQITRGTYFAEIEPLLMAVDSVATDLPGKWP